MDKWEGEDEEEDVKVLVDNLLAFELVKYNLIGQHLYVALTSFLLL